MLSKKTRYALMALTKLSREYGKGAILISDIAKAESIPQRFLENILLELKNVGLLGSKLGKNGGYFLLKSPEEISLADVIRYFEGTIALVYCGSEKTYQPSEFWKNEETCKLKSVFKTIRDNTFNVLQETSIADITQS